MKLSRKVIIIISLVLVFLIGGGIAVATNTPAARAQRQLNLGNKYLEEGKYQEAILAFQKVIEIEPKNIPARLGLGKAYVVTNQFDKAEAVLKEVIGIDSNNIPAREELFKVYVKEGNLDAANGVLKEITTIDPQRDIEKYSTDLDLAKAISASKVRYDQGIKQMKEKQYLEAIDSFQNVIKEDTERYADAQTKLGECKKTFVDETLQKAKDAAANKDYQTALDLLEQVLKVDPNNQEALQLKSDYGNLLQEENKKTAQNTSKSLRDNFMKYAIQGRIPEAEFSVGTPMKSVINLLGTPEENQFEHADIAHLKYGNVLYKYQYYKDPLNDIVNDVNTVNVDSIEVIEPAKAYGIELGKVTLNEIEGILGKPSVPKSFGATTAWYIKYDFSNYSVCFTASYSDSAVYSCLITKKY